MSVIFKLKPCVSLKTHIINVVVMIVIIMISVRSNRRDGIYGFETESDCQVFLT